jgi:hypothetical protein
MKNSLILFALLILTGCKSAETGKERMLSGTVSSHDGEFLPFVSITVKGTKRGIQTDINGKYSISVRKGETLVFAYVGFRTFEIEVASQPALHVQFGAIELLSASTLEMPVKKRTISTTHVSDGDIIKCGEPLDGDHPQSMFQTDLKDKNLQLYIQGGIASSIRPIDKFFEDKYAVKYHDFGCIAPQNPDKYIKYNQIVFNYLKQHCDADWQKQINTQVLGWDEWKRKQVNESIYFNILGVVCPYCRKCTE